MKTFLFMTNSDWGEELNICLADELEEVMKGWGYQIEEAARIKAAELEADGEVAGEGMIAEEMRRDLRRSWFVPSDDDLADFIAESGTRRYTASDAAEAEIERRRVLPEEE